MRGAAGGDSHVTLKIPRPLYDQLKQVIQGSGFHSVTEFAVYVLRDLISHRSRLDQAAPVTDKASYPEPQGDDVEPLSPDEIDAIRKRLESLGYL